MYSSLQRYFTNSHYYKELRLYFIENYISLMEFYDIVLGNSLRLLYLRKLIKNFNYEKYDKQQPPCNYGRWHR